MFFIYLPGHVCFALGALLGDLVYDPRGRIPLRQAPDGGSRAFLILPSMGISVFATLATAGFLTRRRPDAHKRCMLLASISMLDAPIARIPGVFTTGGPLASLGLQDLFLIACVAHDFASRRRVHP